MDGSIFKSKAARLPLARQGSNTSFKRTASPPLDSSVRLPMRRPLLLMATLALAGCRDSTPLSVENGSGVVLQSVVVSGSGFRQELGNIQPGATVKAELQVSGESGLALSFVASGKNVSLPSRGYFEGHGHYAVTAVVTPGLEAVVDSHLRP